MRRSTVWFRQISDVGCQSNEKGQLSTSEGLLTIEKVEYAWQDPWDKYNERHNEQVGFCFEMRPLFFNVQTTVGNVYAERSECAT